MSWNILIADSDAALRETLSEQFSSIPEFDLFWAHDAIEARKIVSIHRMNLMLLDTNLPEAEGTCKQLRAEGYEGPLIVLTMPGDDIDIWHEAGANDYLTKPFRLPLLLARIRLHLNTPLSAEPVFTIGMYKFRPLAKCLETKNGQKTKLTEKETSILKYMLISHGKLVPKEELLHEVWGYHAGVTTHTLETHIYRLRQKLELEPAEAQILVTEHGGYKLIT
jgi:DNA-binding response OmpR family regulator